MAGVTLEISSAVLADRAAKAALHLPLGRISRRITVETPARARDIDR
jgi:hypothetical protein